MKSFTGPAEPEGFRALVEGLLAPEHVVLKCVDPGRSRLDHFTAGKEYTVHASKYAPRLYLLDDKNTTFTGFEATATFVLAGEWSDEAHGDATAPSDATREADEDIVRRPSHYARFAIEPITFIMRNGFEFWRGNIIKYVCRAGFKLYPGMDAVKSEITDLEKVRRYAEMRIDELKGKEGNL